MQRGEPQSTENEGFAVRRPDRKSSGLKLVKVVMVMLAVGGLAGAGWWLYSSSVFSVKKVQSGSYRFTDQAKLEEVFGSFLGKNIWSLDKGTVADSLATFPWVRDLQVRRRLPGALAVDFREWRPLLILEPEHEGDLPLVLVEDGRLLTFPEELVLPGLPVLVGLEPVTDGDNGPLHLDPEIMPQVLELVQAIELTGLETVCPIDFIVDRPEGFAIVLQDGRGSLLVGREEFASRLQRFMTARDHLEVGLQMDLRFADRITCRRI